MRQFDVVRLSGGELAVVIQSDLLDGFSTRVVVPLVPEPEITPVPRLHPSVSIRRRKYVLAMEQITAIRVSDIEKIVDSLRGREYEVIRSYDMLIAGL